MADWSASLHAFPRVWSRFCRIISSTFANPVPMKKRKPAKRPKDGRSPVVIAERIRGLIQTGSVGAGTHLGTVELAAQFGVSRGPVREALRLLESAGLVRVIPRKGAFVAALGDAEVRDVMAIREVLFALLAEQCARKPAREDLAKLAQASSELESLARNPDCTPRAFQLGTYKFVSVMYKMAAMPRLSEAIRDLSVGAAEVYGHLAMATRDMRQTEVQGYQLLRRAIESQDPSAAFNAAREMHGKGVRRATELNELLPRPFHGGTVQFRGKRRRRSKT
jgi:DNA-binding GntR family transcriptional regulator